MVTGIECEKPGDVNSMAAFLNAAVILIRNLWMSWDLWQSFAKRQSGMSRWKGHFLKRKYVILSGNNRGSDFHLSLSSVFIWYMGLLFTFC